MDSSVSDRNRLASQNRSRKGANSSALSAVATGLTSYVIADIFIGGNGKAVYFARDNRSFANASDYAVINTVVNTGSNSTNITSLSIVSPTANMIAANSTFKLYKP